MKKENFLVGAVIILFVLNLMTIAFLLFGMPGHHLPPPQGEFDKHGPDKHDEIIFNKLKLDDAQKKQFDDLKTEHRKQVESIQETSRKLHDDFFGILKSDPIDTNKANMIVQQIADNQKELDKVTFRHFEKLKGILKPEQKDLFPKFLDEISRPPKERMEGPPMDLHGR
jgi:periplasmic protein CpxP/Spy